jgi:hypothetical protein
MKNTNYTHGFEAKLIPAVEVIERYFSGLDGNAIPSLNKPMTGPKLVSIVKTKLHYPKFNETSLRDCIHQIRERGNVPMGSGSKGYYRINNLAELQDVVEALEGRAKGILHAASCLRNYDQSKFESDTVFNKLFE